MAKVDIVTMHAGHTLAECPESLACRKFSLGGKCLLLNSGVAAHEIGHALGLIHEHQRLDRDKYVTVKAENVRDKAFFKDIVHTYQTTLEYGLPYDFGSIMHYHARGGAKNNSLTIEPHDHRMIRTMGQLSQLSFKDVRLVNTAHCSHVCGTSLQCENGGYQDPRNCSQCICPDLLSGELCQETVSAGSPGCWPKSGMLPLLTDDSTVCMNTPNYKPKGFYEPKDQCTWLINIPRGCNTQLWFEGGHGTPSVLSFRPGACSDWIEIRQGFELNGERLCGVGFEPDGFHYPKSKPLILNSIIIPVSFRSFDFSQSVMPLQRKGARLCYKLENPECVQNSRTVE